MLVTVDGIENFVGNIKARYLRDALVTSADPDVHHLAFGQQLKGRLVDCGVVPESERHALVERWERDPASLVADMVRTTDGKISYCVWEVP